MHLRNALISGAIPAGAPLPETQLAAELGVSTTPIREALGELAAEGLVEIEAHRFKRAAVLDLAAMRELLAVQAQLWRLGYEWGIPRITGADLFRLEAALTAYRDALIDGDIFTAVSASHEFHTSVISASANRELLRATLDRRSLVARFILAYGQDTVGPAGLALHEAMLADIRHGDVGAALHRLQAMGDRLIALTAET